MVAPTPSESKVMGSTFVIDVVSFLFSSLFITLNCGLVGPQNFMTIWNTLFLKKAYMWDPSKFYDDMEHSIFKIMLTCGTNAGL